MHAKNNMFRVCDKKLKVRLKKKKNLKPTNVNNNQREQYYSIHNTL